MVPQSKSRAAPICANGGWWKQKHAHITVRGFVILFAGGMNTLAPITLKSSVELAETKGLWASLFHSQAPWKAYLRFNYEGSRCANTKCSATRPFRKLHFLHKFKSGTKTVNLKFTLCKKTINWAWFVKIIKPLWTVTASHPLTYFRLMNLRDASADLLSSLNSSDQPSAFSGCIFNRFLLIALNVQSRV